MSELTPEQQYQQEYDAETAKLEAAAAGKAPEVITEPAAEPAGKPPEPAAAPAKAPDEKPADPLAQMQEELAKTQKALKDTQAWGTKSAQRLAEIERERQQAEREAARPPILEEHPGLADAIKYVASDPTPQIQAEKAREQWAATIEEAHPGIFGVDIDPELESALVAKRDASGNAWDNPLVAIRDITAEKIAFAERQVGKRFAIEAAKQSQKSAMSVPGTGTGATRTPVDADAEAVLRIQKMTPAEFAKEVARVKGY